MSAGHETTTLATAPSGPTLAMLDVLIAQVEIDRHASSYWMGRLDDLAVAEAYLASLRDWLAAADDPHTPKRASVVQEWVAGLPMMQQTVLLTAVRGPDGLPKYHPTKFVLRWYRRCILMSALDGEVLTDPVDTNGGSFTGPAVKPDPLAGWVRQMDDRVTEYLRALDEVPHHFQLHFMHAVEILGYKHPDEHTRAWWHGVYLRLVHDMHLWPETEDQLDQRLGDSREGWLARGDVATND